MQRTPHNLGHYSFQCGKIGGLQTLSVIPVLAGDSIEFSIRNLMRLSPLARTLSVDARVDYTAFYIPHRHIYGDDWVNLMKDGADSTVALPTLTQNIGLYYLGLNLDTTFGAAPKWLLAGYNRIWNRYFRVLKLTPEVPDSYVGRGRPSGHSAANSPIKGITNVDGTHGHNQRHFGYPCARLKTPYTTGIVSNLTDSDRKVAISDDKLDIIDLAKLKSHYKTEVDRDFFATRYNDVMKRSFGSSVNIDADERPEMLMHEIKSLSGRDIDGTSDATLGEFKGKAISNHSVGIRRKFLPEHGAVWIMALVRFPTIVEYEQHPLIRGDQTYLRLSGDYDLVSKERPYVTNASEWFSRVTSSVSLGTIPYGQHYRHQPNNVHKRYDSVGGYPFLNIPDLGSHILAAYVGGTDYDSVFQTAQLGQWQNQASIEVNVMRHFPSAGKSLYAGVK